MTTLPLSIILLEKDAEGYHKVYIENTSDIPFSKMKMYTGGFYSDDDGVYETKSAEKEFGAILPHSTLYFDSIDYMEIELNVWYHLDFYDEKGEVTSYSVSIPKYNWDEQKIYFPSLDMKGWSIDLELK